jgi:CheY-like chemotaxis protein
MRKRTILIVDDDAELVEATRGVLESRGYVVISAPNGTEGYRKAQADKPDLILLDVMMAHDSEGFEIARELRANARTKDTPVIMLTGIRRAKNLPFSYEPDEDWLPVRAVLEKPVRPDDLLQNIASALGA